jgi:hypothetical protein
MTDLAFPRAVLWDMDRAVPGVVGEALRHRPVGLGGQ